MKVCASPVLSPLNAVETDGTVGPEQNHHITKHIEQQRISVKFSDAGERIVQV